MINQKSIQTVNDSTFEKDWLKPRYADYCFSNIPQTVLNLFTGEFTKGLPNDTLGPLQKKYQKVVLLFIDAFGWQFFDKLKNRYPFLKRFLKNGVVSKLTAQFPSTTAAEVTTHYTGLPVGEHGLYEWTYYEPEIEVPKDKIAYRNGKKHSRTGDSIWRYPSRNIFF
jgi:predicted AlkP superfamily pyrophosphatase or phosphodiesterase